MYDLIVIGGGPAGFSAAVNGARLGLKTLILEKNGYFGGANVASDSGTIGGLFNSTKDANNPQQIVEGFAGEFASRLEDMGGLYRHQRFFNTWLSTHDQYLWKLLADQMCLEENVDVRFYTTFTNASFDNTIVTEIETRSMDKVEKFKSKIFIDASGNGALANKLKIPFWMGKDKKIQSLTSIFRLSDVKWSDKTDAAIKNIQELVKKANENGFNLPRISPFIFHTPNKNGALINATSVEQEFTNGSLTALDGEMLTHAEMKIRPQINEYYKFLKLNIPGFENSYISSVADKIGIRQTRSFEGLYTLKNSDVINAKKFKHGIVKSAWPIEIHKGSEGVSIFSLEEDYYEIPFECFVPKKYDNMYFIGKIMSAEHEALASARVVAQCLEEGKAMAYAAKMQIEEMKTNKEIDPIKIRNWMKDTGSNL